MELYSSTTLPEIAVLGLHQICLLCRVTDTVCIRTNGRMITSTGSRCLLRNASKEEQNNIGP